MLVHCREKEGCGIWFLFGCLCTQTTASTIFAFSISTAIVVTIPVHWAPACKAQIYITCDAGACSFGFLRWPCGTLYMFLFFPLPCRGAGWGQVMLGKGGGGGEESTRGAYGKIVPWIGSVFLAYKSWSWTPKYISSMLSFLPLPWTSGSRSYICIWCWHL